MSLSPAIVDAIIFDMDGTLWNACHSYAQVWNITLSHFGKTGHITEHDMQPYMGMAIEDIMNGLLVDYEGLDHRAFLDDAMQVEEDFMPVHGGVLYPGVIEGLEKLSCTRQLFMVSNCGPAGLVNFMRFTGTESFFIDTMTYGENPVPKSANMRCLVAKHQLAHAVYMGDTQSDCEEAHKAGLPFAHAAYGFGQCSNPDWSFNTFNEFVEYFLKK